MRKRRRGGPRGFRRADIPAEIRSCIIIDDCPSCGGAAVYFHLRTGAYFGMCASFLDELIQRAVKGDGGDPTVLNYNPN